MRIAKTWLRPILTAVLFPIILTGSMWALDHFTDEEWLPWTHVAVSSHQAIAVAESKCFARAPSYFDLKPWQTKLRDNRWAVWATRKGRYWTWPSHSDAYAYAAVDAQTGAIIQCHMGIVD